MYPEKNNDKNRSLLDKLSPIFGMLFIGWFFGSIGLMMYFIDSNELYGVMIFGQVFFFFGLIPLVKDKHPIGIPFVLTGLGCIVIPLLILNKDKLSITVNWEELIAILILSGMIIGVLLLIYLVIIVPAIQKKKYSISVIGELIRYEKIGDGNTHIFVPVYQYELDGLKKEVLDKSIILISEGETGEVADIRINPEDQEDMIFHQPFNPIFLLFLLSILIILVTVLIILIFKTNIII